MSQREEFRQLMGSYDDSRGASSKGPFYRLGNTVTVVVWNRENVDWPAPNGVACKENAVWLGHRRRRIELLRGFLLRVPIGNGQTRATIFAPDKFCQMNLKHLGAIGRRWSPHL